MELRLCGPTGGSGRASLCRAQIKQLHSEVMWTKLPYMLRTSKQNRRWDGRYFPPDPVLLAMVRSPASSVGGYKVPSCCGLTSLLN
jgi:hypothetical protein